MCTLSWLPEPEGYTLWFNRDELHTRAAELAPQAFRTVGGSGWLAPTDPDSGGTWLMVNQHGVTVALLNDYRTAGTAPADGTRESRGRLAPLVADARTAEEAVAGLRALDLQRTPPFELVAIDGAGGVARLHWNGRRRRLTQHNEVAMPLTSSSYAPERVREMRLRAFPQGGDARAIAAYHHFHDTEAAAESVNMSRPDAATRSISCIRVGAEWVIFDYEPQNWPGSPSVTGGRRQWRMPRLFAVSSVDPE